MTNYIKRYANEGYYEVADRFVEYAEQQGVHPATLAIAWVAGHHSVTAPIIGSRNVDQLKHALAAAEFDLTEEMRIEISALSPQPPLATDRSEEVPG